MEIGVFISIAKRAAIAVLLAAAVGCAGTLPRLDPDGAMESARAPGTGLLPRTTVTLPKNADIRKIEIIPREPIRKFQVWIRTPENRWEKVRDETGRYSRKITLDIGRKANAVRVVDLKPASKRSSRPHVGGVSGSIKHVLVYGYWLDGSY